MTGREGEVSVLARDDRPAARGTGIQVSDGARNWLHAVTKQSSRDHLLQGVASEGQSARPNQHPLLATHRSHARPRLSDEPHVTTTTTSPAAQNDDLHPGPHPALRRLRDARRGRTAARRGWHRHWLLSPQYVAPQLVRASSRWNADASHSRDGQPVQEIEATARRPACVSLRSRLDSAVCRNGIRILPCVVRRHELA